MSKYTSDMHEDILGRLRRIDPCNVPPETKIDMTVLEVSAMTVEIELLQFALKNAKAEAWEACADKAYELYLTEEQRDELHAANPYREESS